MEMADFIADREDLTTDTIVELVDQKVVEVTNSKKDEEEVIKEVFFSSKNGNVLPTGRRFASPDLTHLQIY